MIDALVHFTEMQNAGFGRSGRALKALCARYDVPVLKLNKRQYALRKSDLDRLLALHPGPAARKGSPHRRDTRLLSERDIADWIRIRHQEGAWADIPPKRNRNNPICFSPYLYRARNRVERFFNRIKKYRRVATRYDRLAANYLAFVQLGSIRLWLALKRNGPAD